MRASHQTENYTRTHDIRFKMASIAMLTGGVLANTLAFTSSSYLFSRISKDSIDKERKRHDLATEQLQKA